MSKRLQPCLAGTALVFGFVILILGIFSTTIVDNIIHNAVENMLVVDQSSMSADTWHDFLNTHMEREYYIFNITNLEQVLKHGGRLNVEEVRVRFTKYCHKFNVSYPAPDIVQYLEWCELDIYEQDKPILNDTITFVNTFYLGAMATVFGSETYCSVYGISQVVPVVKSTFVEPTSGILQAFRMMMLPYYIGFANQTLQGLGWSYQNIVDQVATLSFLGGQTIGTTYPGIILTDLEISNGLTSNNVRSLWDTNSDYSLVTANGISRWLTALSTQNMLYIADICSHLSISLIKFQTVAGWLQKVVLATDHPYYLQASTLIFSNLLTNLNLTQYGVPQTWPEFGAFQFGTGLFTSVITDPYGLKGLTTNPLMPISTSIYQLGLDSSINCPFEWGQSADACAYGPCVPSGRLNINHALGMLNLTGETIQLALLQTGSGPALCAFLSQPSYATLKDQFTAMGLTSDCSNFADFYSFLYVTVGEHIFMQGKMRGTLSSLSASGTAPQNGGLFTTRSVYQWFWGFNPQDPLNPGTTNEGLTSMPLASEVPSAAYMEAKTIQQFLSPRARYTQLYRGKEDVNKAQQLHQYEGYSSVHYYSDINPSCSHGDPTCDFLVWDQPEIIDGTSLGTQFRPFQEDNLDEHALIYISDAKRNCPVVHTEDVTFKDIKLKRYRVDPRLWGWDADANGTTPWFNENYRLKGAYKGLCNIKTPMGGVPVWLSAAHFLYGDPTLLNMTSGLNPDPEKHDTFVDVEPLTGITMHAGKRLQSSVSITNTLIDTAFYANLFTDYSELIVPVYWLQEFGEVTDDNADSFTSLVYGTRSVVSALQIIFIILGVCLLAVGAKLIHSTMSAKTQVEPMSRNQPATSPEGGGMDSKKSGKLFGSTSGGNTSSKYVVSANSNPDNVSNPNPPASS